MLNAEKRSAARVEMVHRVALLRKHLENLQKLRAQMQDARSLHKIAVGQQMLDVSVNMTTHIIHGMERMADLVALLSLEAEGKDDPNAR